jgi:peptidoglycan/xylan/chitin deacetylase (PgdA/CDA1 family)
MNEIGTRLCLQRAGRKRFLTFSMKSCLTLFPKNFQPMKYLYFLVAVLSTSLLFSASAQTNIHSRKAIICLTYDDGLLSHMNTVLPQLDSVGLKATFFLNSIQGSSEVVSQPSPAVIAWTNAALHGHELANHTLFHPCPQSLGFQKEFAIENYTVERIINEVQTENAILTLLDPKRKERAFAFPCNNFLIHDTDYIVLIKKMGLVKYGRAGGDRNSFTSDFKNINAMKMPSWMVEEGTTLPELVAFAEKVKQAGGIVYQIHGVGAEFFAISKDTHRAFLEYLKAHQDEYWVTTFSEAMDSITSQKSRQ